MTRNQKSKANKKRRRGNKREEIQIYITHNVEMLFFDNNYYNKLILMRIIFNG